MKRTSHNNVGQHGAVGREMRRVLLIYTGGTIGMGRNPVTGALEPLPSTGSSKTYAPSNHSTFSLNGHSYAVKSFSGTGTVPADNYVYAWTSLRNYYLFEYYGNAHKELASLHVGSPVVINGQTLHVREIITNVSNDGSAYDLVARKMQQYKAGWQTCEYAAYGSTLRLWFAN